MTTKQIDTRLAHWETAEGRPYKGRLIDWDAYNAAPDNIGCMCAQGQALHLLGGWTPKRLYDAQQIDADKAAAKLLNISVAHSVLLRNINDSIDGAPSIVLTDPGKVLGDQWSKLLDFWWHMDHMDDAAWAAAWAAAGEIQGAAIFNAAERPFYFLPLFGFASPTEIPARPADYGVMS